LNQKDRTHEKVGLLRFDCRLVLKPTQNVERTTVIDLVANTSIIVAVDLTVRAADGLLPRLSFGTSRCERTLTSICTNYFVASYEIPIRTGKPVGALIEAIRIADLFIFHRVSLRFLWPKANFSLPLFTWISGHSSALRDTEGHKKIGVFIERLRFC
jgi:hypothetical protein